MKTNTQQDKIVNQFTKQAKAYTSLPAHHDGLSLLQELCQLNANDIVLDVACGSGIVACAFAERARHVTGLDLTEAMLQEARVLQKSKNLTNIDWHLGDALPLPFEREHFSVVITRFSFHHFLEPELVLAEMVRVCKPKGIVMVVDVALPDEKVAAYNQMEKWRDPSHVKAHSPSYFRQLFERLGLTECTENKYEMSIALQAQLEASFAENKQGLEEMIRKDVGINALGVDVQNVNGALQLHYPIHIFCGRK